MANLYREQDKVEVNRVTSHKRHQEKSWRYLQENNPNRFRIKQIAKLPGVTVWTVNGAAIRRTTYVDFTMGGHGYRYFFVPLNEIWIDQAYARKADLWPTIWHEFFERILMRHKLSYSAAHTMASRLEIILREGTTFVLPVGAFRQTKGYCGPAAAKIYLDYLGSFFTEQHLAKLFGTTPASGTDPAALKTAVKELGFRVEHRGRPLTARNIQRFCKETGAKSVHLGEMIAGVERHAKAVTLRKAWTVGAVKQSIRRGLPIMANVQDDRKYGSGHYCLIIGFTKETFILSDPQEDRGYREVPIEEFMQLWYELEDGTFREGFTIEPRR
ncbi:MAG: C39 family peptidase [Candidatus Magasanikbacteria bacterium]|nr:C39 family peptidase [Candidatus Magasanikbacteria bacterium]